MRILSVHDQVEILTARYGSRRAVLEEIDRRKRLTLLSTKTVSDEKSPGKGNSPRIQNQPNPQWREIDTPSLLIAPKTLDGHVDPPPKVTILSSHEIPEPKPYDNGRHCKSCGVDNDSTTIGCRTCEIRHSARRKRERLIQELSSIRETDL